MYIVYSMNFIHLCLFQVADMDAFATCVQPLKTRHPVLRLQSLDRPPPYAIRSTAVLAVYVTVSTLTRQASHTDTAGRLRVCWGVSVLTLQVLMMVSLL